MNKSHFLVALGFLLVAAGCNSPKFEKAEDGSEYKIDANKSGTLAATGNYLQLEVKVKYGDSTLFSTIDNGMPNFAPYDTTVLPKFFRTVHEGDSLTIQESTDSIIKKGQAAPWMKGGKFITQGIKVVKVIANKETADSIMKTFEGTARAKAYDKAVTQIKADMVKNAGQMKTDDKIITDYMAAKNLTGANKTEWGVYAIVTTPGTGPNLTQKDVAVINYTGKSFQDSAFDSNTDKKFEHVKPLYVDMGEFRVIPGWIDGLKQFNKGAKGKIIIPSFLAYGLNGAPPKIAPNENIVFDIEVTDIITREAYQKQMEEQQKMMQMMQQQMQQQQQKPTAPPTPPTGK
ncbi:MAG: FKBP-type peptidyl-prolyl cis-trans isomerase [Ginsengibacter sp.]